MSKTEPGIKIIHHDAAIVEHVPVAGAVTLEFLTLDDGLTINFRQFLALVLTVQGQVRLGPEFGDGRTGHQTHFDRALRIEALVHVGASVDCADNNGASSRGRTRCSDAVRALLAAGANTKAQNKDGSTPFHLAVQNTGRGGTGADRSRTLQFQIIEIFKKNGVSVELKDGKGRTLLDSCRSDEVRALLA